MKLSLLSGERIEKFVYASDLIFICTEKGEVFGFGNSLDRIENKIISPQKVSSLLGLKVVDIAIGPNKQHLALCADGKLYRFEFDNQVRYLIDTSTVDAKLTNIFHVTGRDCVSLLENGEVLKVVIGDAAFLHGEDNNNCEKDRCEVMCFQKAGDLVDHSKIKKLITGYDYALALDESGRLFGTGCAEDGQLGIELEPSIKHYENWELNSSITEKYLQIISLLNKMMGRTCYL
ncbi:uncharacterized protein LOC135834152 [Planococcus citri]|uniref:uncharacterized protein LOC135834152 n=1 Tax=Planococcus citri TaxID=170843 RepID=UPI0031F7F0F5